MVGARIRERVKKKKKARTTSDDVGGNSVSEKSKSTGGKCVSENQACPRSPFRRLIAG